MLNYDRALINLFTGIAELITSKTGKLIIPQSFVDHIHQAKLEIKKPITSPRLVIYNKDNTIRHQFMEDAFNDYCSTLNEIIHWIDQYCKVEPIKLRISIPLDEQNENEIAFGKLDYDSILVAKANEYVLINDDFITKLYSIQKFEISTISSQFLFKYLRSENKDVKSKNAFNGALLNLIKLNYRLIELDPSLMLFCSLDDDKFRLILQCIADSLPKQGQLINILRIFLKEMWDYKAADSVKRQRTCQVLDILLIELDPTLIYNSFCRELSITGSTSGVSYRKCLDSWFQSKYSKDSR